MSKVVICDHCGAKIRATRTRCPRCREPLVAASTAPGFDFNRAAPMALGLLAFAAVVTLYGFWRQTVETTEVQAAVASPTVVAPATSRPRPVAERAAPDTEIPFIEPNRAGGRAYEAGDYDRALALYQDAVKRHPRDAESWSNLGQVLVRLNRAEAAVGPLQRAVALNGERWAYHFNLARALGLMDRWPEAVEAYARAQRLYPDDYAIAHNFGLALRKKGDDAAAVEQFRRAIALDPGDPGFQFALAMSLDRLGRREDALAAYRKTLELDPAVPEAPQIRARIDTLLH